MVVSEPTVCQGAVVQLLLAMMDLHDTCGSWVVVGIRVYPIGVGPKLPCLGEVPCFQKNRNTKEEGMTR